MTDYSVTELDLSNQGLTELPKDIHLYKNLEELYCDDNQITTLPENLPASLKELYCSNNRITALPENLPDSLEILDCNNNQITALPENWPASLEILDCGNNPITKDYDFEITKETLPRYYKEKEEKEKTLGEGMYNAVFK